MPSVMYRRLDGSTPAGSRQDIVHRLVSLLPTCHTSQGLMISICNTNLFRYQSMPGRNWCTSVNSHVHLRLHERLLYLFGIARAIQDLSIRAIQSFFLRSTSNVSLRTEQGKAEL